MCHKLQVTKLSVSAVARLNLFSLFLNEFSFILSFFDIIRTISMAHRRTNQTTNNFTNVISILRQIKLDVPALSASAGVTNFSTLGFLFFLHMCQLAAPASTVFMALSALFSRANIFVAAAAAATARHNQCYCVTVCDCVQAASSLIAKKRTHSDGEIRIAHNHF